MKLTLQEFRQAIETAYRDGFMVGSEGYNGDYAIKAASEYAEPAVKAAMTRLASAPGILAYHCPEAAPHQQWAATYIAPQKSFPGLFFTDGSREEAEAKAAEDWRKHFGPPPARGKNKPKADTAEPAPVSDDDLIG